MPDDLPQPALIVFAKSPISGCVKTRLMPELSAQQAAQVATVLIENTIRQAMHNWPGDISLCAWPDARHPLLQSLATAHQLSISVQCGVDLGERMLNALRLYTARGRPAAILGCDVPHCPGQQLRRAYYSLQHGRNIIGPSQDGGYYLIGLQQAHADIFDGIQWGGKEVMQQTLDAAHRCGVIFERLISLVDIDTYQDLKRVAERVPDLNRWLKQFTLSRNDKNVTK